MPPDIEKSPVVVISEFPPEKVPPAKVKEPEVVIVLPLLCVMVPVYPLCVEMEVTLRLAFTVAFPSQSASKIIVSPLPGAVVFPFALQSDPLAGAVARQLLPTLVFPPEPIQ